ncbi:hypothetical protein KSP40_PGU012747 [Platanthera guangdongensis]|uniref:DNA helicase n=1 Tax=Platanthera guangdongensis TaxID=2320717 RepID=A0ABR2MCS8_9ASPA
MFKNEVAQLDAVASILCIESSMTTSAIVDSVGNALHSNFAEFPDQECILHNGRLGSGIVLLNVIIECTSSCSLLDSDETN